MSDDEQVCVIVLNSLLRETLPSNRQEEAVIFVSFPLSLSNGQSWPYRIDAKTYRRWQLLASEIMHLFSHKGLTVTILDNVVVGGFTWNVYCNNRAIKWNQEALATQEEA
jgi:hypothetical protein